MSRTAAVATSSVVPSSGGRWNHRWPRGSSRVVSVVVGVMLLVSVGVGPLATNPSAAANGTPCLVGAGTLGDPFLVETPADLAKVGSGADGCALSASYLQTANIALAAPGAGASNHTPIGAFTGVYDGGGFTIDGPVVVVAGNDVGFFGSTSGATIRDVHITRGSITGGEDTGGLIGQAANSTVSGTSFSGTVTSSADYVGGLIGYAPRTGVFRSFSEGTVTGGTDVGGLVGYLPFGGVSASYSTADVHGTGADVGGLIGYFPNANLRDSFARGDVTVTGTANGLGGLSGYVPSSAITRVYSTGAVTGTGGAIGGLVGEDASTSFTDSFWDTQTSEQLESAAGMGKTTAELTSRATFADTATEGLTTAWPIVAGWAPYVDGTTVWGICTGVNNGYPFLLWQFDTDPCSAPVSSSSLALSCDGTRAVGTKVTCTVTGGDAGIDILWRAAYNPVIAETGVTLDASGSGVFSFTVPAGALGEELTVELVDWTAPMSLGVVGGPVPGSVPAGGGPVPMWTLGLLALAGVLLHRLAMTSAATKGLPHAHTALSDQRL